MATFQKGVKGFIDISVLGDKKLQKQLKNIELKMQKKIVKKALRMGTKVVLARAKALVPVSLGNTQGKHLRDTLKIKAFSKKGVFGSTVITGTREQLGIDANDRWYYPAHVELGTKKMSPRPYLRPALRNNVEKIKRIVGVEIKRGINQALTV